MITNIRSKFGEELYKQMEIDKDIFILTGDLGYKLLDKHKEGFPDRVTNVGASEQAMIGIACGMALEGLKPFVYSITNFLIYRPFEWIRNYIDHEKIPVRLVGSGLGKDYAYDGFTHQCEDLKQVLDIFKNINQLYPSNGEEVSIMLEKMVKEDKPWFMGLKR
jgi:transketolase